MPCNATDIFVELKLLHRHTNERLGSMERVCGKITALSITRACYSRHSFYITSTKKPTLKPNNFSCIPSRRPLCWGNIRRVNVMLLLVQSGN